MHLSELKGLFITRGRGEFLVGGVMLVWHIYGTFWVHFAACVTVIHLSNYWRHEVFIFPCRYNPENDTESRLLRHRALALQDMAHSFLDHELSEEFEKVR